MNYSIKLILSVSLIALFASKMEAKSWRGIVPGRSSRDDVARLLNRSIDPQASGLTYDSANEEVVFLFSRPVDESVLCNVKPGTVLSIQIIPRIGLPLSGFGLDKNKLRELESSAEFIINGQAYADDNEGLVVSAEQGIVKKIVYIASKEDQGLCAEYYEEKRRFADRIICILCPTISVTCPDNVEPGTVFTFTANVTIGNPAPQLTYKWTISAGTIVSGQGTEAIKVDSGKTDAPPITATVEVGGMDPACSKTASCATTIIPRKN